MAVVPIPASQPQSDSQSLLDNGMARTPAIDLFLMASLCGLAFLLASTPARNSDLWLHLASGRWHSAAQLPDGTDPFSSTTVGVFWVNHTWLSDVFLYQIYRLGDGTALIVVKAVLMALLAALWCFFRRRGEGMGLLALAGFTALLALAPWLSLQPILLSLLGLLLTLYLMERPYLLDGASSDRARRQRWLLVPLFAVWANLDGWFILGPVLVGLYAVGELLRRITNHPAAYAAGSLVLFCAGLAACLATPYHYRIFTWPTLLGMSQAEQALQHDPLGQNLIVSSFGARFVDSPAFHSPGAWAYYLLLAASGVSFVLGRRNLHPGRLLVWLLLAGLSIYQARTIPFFAVAAAPLLALNVAPGGSRFARPTLLGAIVLLVLAWPGWLQTAPYQPRGWRIEPDGSLVRMTERLKRWHTEAAVRPDRFALTFSPEAAHYLAWFCPQEKGFVDSRWPLFDRVAGDYVYMRRCLFQPSGDTDAELAALLDAYHIDRILLHDNDWQQMSRAYRHLFLAPAEWELLAMEGGATVFRRRDGSPSAAKGFDLQRAVYHPAVDARAPSPPEPPQPPGLLDPFWRSRNERSSADLQEAALHILSFDVRAESFAFSWVLGQTTGIIGCASGTDPAATATALALRFQFAPSPPPSPDEPLLLAVRAARRALGIDPNEGRAFLLLGEAYYRLARHSREANWHDRLPALAEMRRVQTLTALEQAVLLRPDLDRAHELLAQLYIEPSKMFEEGQGDRCLEHLRARLDLARNADQRNALQADVDRLEDLVKAADKIYQANIVGKTDPTRVLLRAQLAARHSLSRKALDMILESNLAIYGKPGLEYELELMAQAGMSYQIRDILNPEELEKQIDFFAYHRLKAYAAASCGDYVQADAEMDKANVPRRWIGISAKTPALAPLRWAVALRAARAVLTHPLEMEGVVGRVSELFLQMYMLEPLGAPARFLREEADQQVLRGILALEAGAVETARDRFRAAVNVWGSESMAAEGGGQDFLARPIAQEMLRRLQE